MGLEPPPGLLVCAKVGIVRRIHHPCLSRQHASLPVGPENIWAFDRDVDLWLLSLIIVGYHGHPCWPSCDGAPVLIAVSDLPDGVQIVGDFLL